MDNKLPDSNVSNIMTADDDMESGPKPPDGLRREIDKIMVANLPSRTLNQYQTMMSEVDNPESEPALFQMISTSTKLLQLSATTANKGALTKAFIEAFTSFVDNDNWDKVLKRMYESKLLGKEVMPLLSCNVNINRQSSPNFFPRISTDCHRRALLIGNKDEVDRFSEYLAKKQGFEGAHGSIKCLVPGLEGTENPTKGVVETALRTLAEDSKAGDLALLYYCGESGNNGITPYLVLADGSTIGFSSITDNFLRPLPDGVHLRVLMDPTNCGSLFVAVAHHIMPAIEPDEMDKVLTCLDTWTKYGTKAYELIQTWGNVMLLIITTITLIIAALK